jgi:very-short-patch-repair endonuclease
VSKITTRKEEENKINLRSLFLSVMKYATQWPVNSKVLHYMCPDTDIHIHVGMFVA